MLCLWDYHSFAMIKDYDSWEKELCEDADIRRHISAGHFVPLNLLSDGAFSVALRKGSPDTMSKREKEYLLVPSQPYFLKTSGRVLASGLEQVNSDPDEFLEILLDAGDYVVRPQLIDWAAEPGSKDSQGRPSPSALPDFLVFIEPVVQTAFNYRQEIETFRKEDSLR